MPFGSIVSEAPTDVVPAGDVGELENSFSRIEDLTQQGPGLQEPDSSVEFLFERKVPVCNRRLARRAKLHF